MRKPPVFRFLRKVAHILTTDATGSMADDDSGDERRQDPRFSFEGKEVSVRARGLSSSFRIKDVSCGGVCGVTGIPVPVGGTVSISLPDLPHRTAEVRWVRNTTMGLKFDKPLTFGETLRFCAGSQDLVRVHQTSPLQLAECLLAANDS
jgi:hypothetical protein